MLRDEQIAAFDRDGFLNSGPILDNAEIDDIASGLARVLDVGPDGFVEGQPQPVSFQDLRGGAEGASDHPVWQIVNIWEASP
ncbi:MAG: phytanoyl-CoA dioxygenase family protein, partial [Candidatus Latescibacterota bacterium]